MVFITKFIRLYTSLEVLHYTAEYKTAYGPYSCLYSQENQHLRKRGSKSQLNISLPVSGLSDQKGDFATHGSI